MLEKKCEDLATKRGDGGFIVRNKILWSKERPRGSVYPGEFGERLMRVMGSPTKFAPKGNLEEGGEKENSRRN